MKDDVESVGENIIGNRRCWGLGVGDEEGKMDEYERRRCGEVLNG